MKTCSETIKLCGLKSTKQVADLNSVTARSIQLAYKNDKLKFNAYVFLAVDEVNDALYERVKFILGCNKRLED